MVIMSISHINHDCLCEASTPFFRRSELMNFRPPCHIDKYIYCRAGAILRVKLKGLTGNYGLRKKKTPRVLGRKLFFIYKF